MIKRNFKTGLFVISLAFAFFFASPANTHPSSFYFSFGYPTYFSGSYYSSSRAYLYSYPFYPGYAYIPFPFLKPVPTPDYQLINQLAALGETKKQIWLEAQNQEKPLVQNPIPPPPDETILEAPEIRTLEPEISQ